MFRGIRDRPFKEHLRQLRAGGRDPADPGEPAAARPRQQQLRRGLLRDRQEGGLIEVVTLLLLASLDFCHPPSDLVKRKRSDSEHLHSKHPRLWREDEK